MTALRSTEALKGATCAVLGFGISNRPLVGFLLDCGARVCVRDQKNIEALGEDAVRMMERGATFQTGEDYLSGLCEQYLFRSPGLRPDLPEIREALSRGSVLTSEMELFLELTPTEVVGVTGSDGKTTTTTLTGLLFSQEYGVNQKGRVFVGGNIGEPLLPKLAEMTKHDLCVVELSSFQLQTMTRSLSRAAVTNLSENHLNWHLGMNEYVESKTNIYRHPENERLVTNAECDLTVALAKRHRGAVTYFSSVRTDHTAFADLLRDGDRAVYCKDGCIVLWDGEREQALLETKEIRLPGKHNLENYMTAIALTDGLVSRESILAVARAFTGVRHRLEPVRELDGVTYYNSSIDSSPTRTAAALSAMEKKPIVICGGRNKGLDFTPLADALCARAKAVILTGEAANEIKDVLKERETVLTGALAVWHEPNFTEAVCLSRRIARSGDVVLLSPSCTSFDAFRNFEERGDTFCKIVKGW